MDLFLRTLNPSSRTPTWDLVISKGVIKTLSGEAELAQKATVSAFIQRGTIPQEPSVGNVWAEMLVGDASPAEADSLARSNIRKYAGTVAYSPKYSLEGTMVKVEISKEG